MEHWKDFDWSLFSLNGWFPLAEWVKLTSINRLLCNSSILAVILIIISKDKRPITSSYFLKLMQSFIYRAGYFFFSVVFTIHSVDHCSTAATYFVSFERFYSIQPWLVEKFFFALYFSFHFSFTFSIKRSFFCKLISDVN